MHRTARRVRTLSDLLAAAIAERDRLVCAARADGVSFDQLGALVGVTAQRVKAIVDRPT